MKFTLRSLILVSSCMLASAASSTTWSASLGGVRALGTERYQLHGDFGVNCKTCEVIIVYPEGLRYAHRVVQWTPQQIIFRVADLNRGVDVRVGVQTANGKTNELRLRLIQSIFPEREFTSPVANTELQQYGFFERNHDLAVGDKGEDLFDVSAAAPGCRRPAKLFNHARITYRNQRFGQAQIVSLPTQGCVRCTPIKIRWYHEPTGRLTYQLHIYRRVVEGICPDRVR